MASMTQGDEQLNKSEIEVLEDELSSLAYEWRRLASLGYDEEASHVVSRYHAVFARLRELGWDSRVLLPDEELPGKLMPK